MQPRGMTFFKKLWGLTAAATTQDLEVKGHILALPQNHPPVDRGRKSGYGHLHKTHCLAWRIIRFADLTEGNQGNEGLFIYSLLFKNGHCVFGNAPAPRNGWS